MRNEKLTTNCIEMGKTIHDKHSSQSVWIHLVMGIAIGCCFPLMLIGIIAVSLFSGTIQIPYKTRPTLGYSSSVVPSVTTGPFEVAPMLAASYDQSPEHCVRDIHEAARVGTVNDVKYFLEKGVDVNARGVDVYARDRYDLTPLHFAAKFNTDIEVLKYLLDKGADVHATTNVHSTPLHGAAIRNSNVSVVKSLVDHGADVNAKNIFGVSALHLAASNSSEVVEYLIERGAEINMKDHGGHTPLDFAIAQNREENATIFREAGGKRGDEL